MRVKVKVIPSAKETRIEVFGDGIKVYLTEPALRGRANKKLIEVLADYYNTKKYNVTLVKGQAQREKVIEIREAD
ncbi:MAG: DUF167 domain-containing protein [Candidatus Omnitrophota bacterium]|nr:MAG: DUF167 domain-containing protein [Candidatus Omnitrophota bacterium]